MGRIEWIRVMIVAVGVAGGASASAQPAPARPGDDWDDPDDVEAPPPPAALERAPGDISEVDIQELLEIPVVEAASKRRQSLYEAPAAISSFKGPQIVSANPILPVEVLRRVPGAHVMQLNANGTYVGLRGWNNIVNTHIPVLIDGRRLTEGSLGYPPWGAFPLPLGEIESIEVLRGPGATLYGVDAFSGVISVTSRDPLDTEGAEGIIAAGMTILPLAEGDDRQARLGSIGAGSAAATWRNDARTFALRGSVGLSYVPEWQEIGAGLASQPFYRYGPAALQANLSASARPGATSRLRVGASYVATEIQETVTATGSRAQLTAYRDTAANLSFEQRELGGSGVSLRVQADAANQLKTNESRDTMGETHLGERRFNSAHGLVQLDWSAWRGRNVLTLGAEGSFRVGRLEQVAEGIPVQQPQALYGALFAQDEIKLTHRPDLVLNVGVRVEQIEAEDPEDGAEVTYANVSPRASLIFRPAKHHSLRASAATGFRQPSLFEAFVSETVTGFDPPFVVVAPNPSLRPEKVRSVELGYRGKPAAWLRVDATVWAQQLRDIIVTRSTASPVVLENMLDLDQVGVELGAQMKVGHASGYLSYGLTVGLDDSDEKGVPTHIVAVGGDVLLGKRTTFGADGYFTSAWDATFLAPDGGVNQVITREAPAQTIVNLRLATRVGDSAEVFVHGMNVLAGLRDVDDLEQYPAPTVHPIGTTAMIGLRVGGL